MTKKEFIGIEDIDEIDLERCQDYEEVVIKDCPNLNFVNFDTCRIKKITIENCPNLETFQGYNNDLTQLTLNDFPKLEKIYVPFNKIKRLFIKNCPQLLSLICNNNRLILLSLKGSFKNLKTLDCYKNDELKSLSCNDLENLEEVNAQECSIKYIFFNKCKKLKKVDLAENSISTLNISNCVELEELSCRDNLLQDLDLSNNKNLTKLVLYNNLFPPMDISKFSHLTKMTNLLIGLHLMSDEKSRTSKNSQRVFKYHKTNRWYGSLEAFKDMKDLFELSINASDIDRGQEFLPKSLSHLYCLTFDNLLKSWLREMEGEPRKVKAIYDWWEVEKAKRQQKSTPNESDEVPEPEKSMSGWKNKGRKETQACDYEPPANKDKIRYLDLSHWRLKGDLVIEDYPNLKELNVGNNKLTSLIVRNCPKLTILRYPHNCMSEEATIERCDNLTTIDNYKYNDGDWDSHMSSEEIKKQEKRAENDKEKIKIDNQLYLFLQRVEKGDDISFQEFLNLAPRFIGHSDEDLSEKFYNLFASKLETHILDLVNKVKNGIITKSQLIKEIEPLKLFLYLLNDKTKAQLQTLLESFTQKEQTLIKNINYFPFYLIFILAFIRIGLLLFKKNKKVKVTNGRS